MCGRARAVSARLDQARARLAKALRRAEHRSLLGAARRSEAQRRPFRRGFFQPSVAAEACARAPDVRRESAVSSARRARPRRAHHARGRRARARLHQGRRLMVPVEASLGVAAPSALEVPEALRNLKTTLQADSVGFCREVGFRLPAALEAASSSEIRQHLGPFLEQTFRAWAERESDEVRVALEALSRRVLASLPESEADADRAPAGPDSRLTRPAIEVSTFAL